MRALTPSLKVLCSKRFKAEATRIERSGSSHRGPEECCGFHAPKAPKLAVPAPINCKDVLIRFRAGIVTVLLTLALPKPYLLVLSELKASHE